MKIKKFSVMILILSLIFVTISGCSTTNQAPPSSPVKTDVISGSIGTVKTIVYDDNNNLVSFLVEGDKEVNSNAHYYDKAIVTKTGVTKLYIGDNEEEIPVNELKEGMNVEIIYYGDISNSYPVKATARTIRIVETK